ncbi:MAG: DedA family protein/thiosulfate sulfurtransferase GlpE [Polaromonas sp.]|nr:DedA family protein/thiosulfate sulfurtransferase GlpE [Polaromonas sp.]
MNQIISWLEQYGLAAVFLNIGLEQLGLPIPAYPVLILTGALSFNGQYSAGGQLLTAVLACLIADSIWYWAGHRYGSRVLKTLCRISLSPDSCVRQTESIFTRWGVKSLVLAKFIPGFASLATALAGRTGVPFGRFLFFDAIGATLYAGVGLAIGMVFHDAVADVLAVFEQMGRIGLMVLLVAFALFLVHKWWQRQRFYRQLRMARISPAELLQLTQGPQATVILDVRTELARAGGGIIPGALLWSDPDRKMATLDLPHDVAVVVYCACPNDASAAQVARRLMAAGFRNVRPLHGGIDAWQAAGLALEYPAKPA